MTRSGFGRDSAHSPFLAFVAKEFHKRGTQRRWELSKKFHSHPFVRSLGMRVAVSLGSLEDIEALRTLDLPDRFVLKFANGWSSRGVMPLERTGQDAYFDHLQLRTWTLDGLVQQQRRIAKSFGAEKPRWLLEEFIAPTLGVGAIPFDYKFYCFNGAIGMVGQFDRNTNPPKLTLFDGQFMPLRHGRDYLRGSDKIQRGIPLVPLHAPEMMWWAQTLSSQADSPFVSIDMYDSPDGPVFGEFTYSPGATHKQMVVFSHGMIDRFDALFAGAGSGDPLGDTSLEVRQSLPLLGGPAYRSLAGYVYNGGARGAERMAEHYRNEVKRLGADNQASQWMQRISDAWTSVQDVVQQLLRAQTATARPKGAA